MSSVPHYRVFGTDAECLDLFDRAGRKDPYYLPSELPLPSSIQGFCICDAKSRGAWRGLLLLPLAHGGQVLRKNC